MDPYTPTHLKPDAVADLYRQALEQAEVQTLSAWANYLRARAAQDALEADLARVSAPKEG